ncbi:hypothetical protein ZWY2020_043486 [Hordeum vulgare]|nr:hypothetical protein ZWY2020_043486 [Hordeum vulgare]
MAPGALPLGVFVVVMLCVGIVRAADADIVAAGRPLSGDQKLVSPGGKFALGLFHPAGAADGSWYVGIWYYKIPVHTPVWVANRETPVSNTSRLAIAPDGNLALFGGAGSIVWSTNANTSGVANASDTVAVLHDSGNLVLTPASNASAVLWQSFDHITDTWLPGGKLRRDKRTGVVQAMASWRARGDPAPGMYALQLDPSGAKQYLLLSNGTRQYWATGNWTGKYFTGAPEVAASRGDSGYTFEFVDNVEESYFTYNFAVNTTVYRFVMDVSGQVKGWFWVEATQGWNLVYAEPKARCAVPRGCGAFGVCSEGSSTACDCARGFSPQSPASWGLGDYIGGCVRNTQLLQCRNNGSGPPVVLNKVEEDKFLRIDGVRLPDDGRMAGAASSGDCQRACLGGCSCSAYAYNGSCFLWHGDLFNLQDGVLDDQAGAGSLYLRLAASELPGARSHVRRDIKVAAVALGVACFVIAAAILLVRTIRGTMKRRRRRRLNGLAVGDGCVSYKYSDLQSLTKNFTDKIGAGAFGSVFKGQFSDDTVVAVKKLEGLRQGEKQFRAEVSTLGTIQHVNLIRMLGFCSDGGDRKLLVYEYMPNGSLDRHLFRKTFYVLSWQVRHQIAVGVAKGLAYLHDKCRDCIIHCDVKPENILLDASFGAKVADFGLAKLVGRDFSRVLTTMRGTVGYLAPEWISGEAITAKADVFSYGMMLFEMVSGRRNVEHGERRSSVASAAEERPTTTFFPLLVARRLAEGDVMTLLDPELEGDANAEEVRRVCNVACWCIQHDVDARPTMGEVVQVLEGLTELETPPVPQYLEVLVGQPVHETAYHSAEQLEAPAGRPVHGTVYHSTEQFLRP